MRLRDSQHDALAGGAMDSARRRELLALQERGFDVNEVGGAIIIRDAAGGSARVESQGLIARVSTAEGRAIETEQYANGRIRRIVDASGREVRFVRDGEGFLQAIDRGPGGGTYRFELSPEWQPLRIEYPDGTAWVAQYSADGQPTRIVQRDGTDIRYEYAPNGRLTSLIDPQGHCIRLSDPGPGASRIIEYPNGDRHEYIDDVDARLLRFDVNGETHARYQYSPGNDSLEIRYRDSSRERFAFSNGRIVEAANEHSTVRLTYDAFGRLLSEDTDGRIVRYLRNQVGALIGIVTPEGETLSYVRDRDQRLTGIIDWVGGRYDMSLARSGPPVELRYPNGLTVATETNAMGLPSTWTVHRSSGVREQVDGASWQHDTCDRLIGATRDGRQRKYRYDRASRLVDVQCSDDARSERFELDRSGNRLQSFGARCGYDAMNRLLRQGSREFQYDGLGNQTSERGGDQPAFYTYNGRGQLVGVRTRGRIIEYVYDALGRRIRKRVGGVTTRYEWAGTQLLSESTNEGSRSVRRDYLVCPEFLTPLAFREGSSVYYIHCGRLQEPLCVTNQGGEVVWKADYLAFGRALISVERVRQPWRLPGQYYDDETGLHYAVARYYAPDLGRFLSMDPRRTPGASLNYYIYCDGDPVNRIDPTGEISLTLGTVLIAVAIGIAIGAVIGAGIELYKQRNEEQTDWSQVGRAAVIGGCLGGIGAAVGAVAAAAALGTLGVLGAGAAAGALGAAAEYCVEAIGKGGWHWDEFGTTVAVGATIGAVTAGIGGVIAGRAARKTAQAAKEAAEAEARALREASETALKEAEERAAREAARAVPKDPDALGKAIGESVKAQPSGKTSSICKQVSELPLSPEEKARALEAASKEAFGETGGVVKAGDDFVVLPNMPPGPGRPIVGVHPDGTTFQGKADLVLDKTTTPWSMKATNISEKK